MASRKLDDHTSGRRKATPVDVDHDGVAGIKGVNGAPADGHDNGVDDDSKIHLQKHGNTRKQSGQRMAEHGCTARGMRYQRISIQQGRRSFRRVEDVP